ncbi:MFS transporter [Kitasatospora sp. NPDC056651]|uniref:MFS transporter n=1 Tax=Kitasatospora sp. NPDC056651 TaxID=3345892 RepID=UPI00368A3335
MENAATEQEETKQPAPEKDATAERQAPPPLRRNRDFLRLWLGAGSTLLGARVSTTAYPLLVVWYTGSLVGAGVVGFAALLPQLLIQLPAGVLVDRLDRRRLMITCDLLGVLSMGSVAAALLTHHFRIPHLVIAAFLEGSCTILYRLAERAAVRNLVHRQHLSAALAQNEARGQAAGLIGQPTGSVLYATGAWLPFAFTALAHLAALGTLLTIKGRFQTERRAEPRSIRAELAEGFAWVWGQRFVRAATALLAGSNFLFQIVSLALVAVIKQSGHSPASVGAVGLVAGVGGILGALSSSRLMNRLTPPQVVTGVLTAWALLIVPIGFVSNPWLLGGLFAGISFTAGLLNVAGGVYQIRITPDEMQGRVTAVGGVLASGANSCGMLAGGLLIASNGVSSTVLGVAAAMAAIAVASVLSPAIRTFSDVLR